MKTDTQAATEAKGDHEGSCRGVDAPIRSQWITGDAGSNGTAGEGRREPRRSQLAMMMVARCFSTFSRSHHRRP